MSRGFGTSFTRLFCIAVIFLLSICSGVAQQPAQSSPPQNLPSSEKQRTVSPEAKPQPNAPAPQATQDQKSAETKPENKITPQQAEQLFRDVDTILQFASNDTSLPTKHGVKRRLIGRDEVVAYLKKSMA